MSHLTIRKHMFTMILFWGVFIFYCDKVSIRYMWSLCGILLLGLVLLDEDAILNGLVFLVHRRNGDRIGVDLPPEVFIALLVPPVAGFEGPCANYLVLLIVVRWLREAFVSYQQDQDYQNRQKLNGDGDQKHRTLRPHEDIALSLGQSYALEEAQQCSQSYAVYQNLN